MVGKTNVCGGGGKLFSVIAVTYPEGSVCTCSDGAKTLKAKDTSGKALFNVTVGEWTVTATDGSSTTSQAVSITEEGQVESVTLTYELVLFDNGTYAEETGGWDFSGSDGGGSIQSNNLYVYGRSGRDDVDGIGYVYTNSKIDLTNFNALNFIVSSCSDTSGGRAFGVSSSQSGDKAFTASASISTGTISVDISSLIGSYYVKGYQIGWTSLGYFNISKVWLT